MTVQPNQDAQNKIFVSYADVLESDFRRNNLQPCPIFAILNIHITEFIVQEYICHLIQLSKVFIILLKCEIMMLNIGSVTNRVGNLSLLE